MLGEESRWHRICLPGLGAGRGEGGAEGRGVRGEGGRGEGGQRGGTG